MSRGRIVTASLVAAGIMFSSFAAAQLTKAPKVEFAAPSVDQSAAHCLLDHHFVLALPTRRPGSTWHRLDIDLCGE
jgi:hypothetical protein